MDIVSIVNMVIQKSPNDKTEYIVKAGREVTAV